MDVLFKKTRRLLEADREEVRWLDDGTKLMLMWEWLSKALVDVMAW